MPFKRIDYRDLDMYYVLNPDPQEFLTATHDRLPDSRPLKAGLPILVFIHAAGANVTAWRAQIGDLRLTSHFNVFACDARFHGWTTGGPRSEHTLENSAECIIATLDSLDFPSYCVYGEGVHGANIAAWIAIKRKEKVKAVLLASPGYLAESPRIVKMLQGVQQGLLVNKDGKGDGSGTLPAESLDDVCAYFIGSHERLAGARADMRDRLQARYGSGAGPSSHDLGWLFRSSYARQPIPPQLLTTITCPVMILRGADDKICCPLEACEEWTRLLTGVKGDIPIHAISSAPGLLSLSDSNILNRIILQFFQRSLTQ
ncbi:hypothetical protein JCM10908_000984 [Rhodotorula pacifica]|uniref:alpha/beta fold hydrolase n=1 Tax=Rhodotorula pacifica TaxID=1495444 RepID=UPI00317FA0F1